MLIWPLCIPILWIIEPIAYLLRADLRWKAGYLAVQIVFAAAFDSMIMHSSVR